MPHDKEPKEQAKSSMIVVRVDHEQKGLVTQAAEREGLQVSSFLIMLLVRCGILPECAVKKLKRRPVPYYNALHGLLGVINKIGGNCKQLNAVLPNTKGLSLAHASVIQAAASVIEALKGYPIPEGINLYRLQGDITREGYVFNQIVKSVNSGRPNLGQLPTTLAAIRSAADVITVSLTGKRVRVTLEDIRHAAALMFKPVKDRI